MADGPSDLRGLSGRILVAAVIAGAPLAALAAGAMVVLARSGPGDRAAPLLVLIATVFSLLVVVIGAVALHRGVARPLGQLRSVLAAADPEAFPQAVLDRPDEVGSLARSLQTAVVQVNEQRDRVEELALRDPDTGLYGAREFRARIDNEVARSRRHGRSLTLLVAAVDGREHLTAAEARALASALEASVRPTDIAARTASTRFAALLPETPGRGAEVVSGRLCDLVSKLPDGVTVSVGLASFPGDAGTVEQLTIAADDAVAAAHAQGGNQVRHYGDL